MKLNNSSDFDLDLFFSNDYFLMHFATAGLQITDDNFYDESHSEFRHLLKNLTIPAFKYELNPNLREILSIKQENDREFNIELYTANFITYAQKGLFSFDRTFIENSSDINFHLVAYPILDSNYNHFLYQLWGIDYEIDYIQINRFYSYLASSNFKKSFEIKF